MTIYRSDAFDRWLRHLRDSRAKARILTTLRRWSLTGIITGDIKPVGEIMTLTRWDAADYLNDDASIIAYLDEVAAEDDPALLQAALGDIARAKGMTAIAQQIGVGRESLYKSLSDTGNPSFQTVARVVRALGGRITITAA
ncbi:addiction module antidote protein [Actinomyces sp. MRS3W]|uniref:addiction module antidote protein n=1 Tax=Actinomyces sp. MRS3W TaxID=2800796 RepID=UPI0028FD19C3|nr:addiction module antidote protein [Actinomyces sp. MRS3W]MDU0348047.1 putative addiction module antidote protein [Actinomyces sp. MRS3W]